MHYWCKDKLSEKKIKLLIELIKERSTWFNSLLIYSVMVQFKQSDVIIFPSAAVRFMQVNFL